MAPTLSEELGLSATDVLEYHKNNLNSDVLELFCHGVYTCVYVYSIFELGSSFTASDKSTIKRRGFHAILITVMWSLATVIFGVRWYYITSTYVDHGDSRESAFDFSASDFSSAVSIVSRVSLSINVMIADCILLWRCWVIYGGYWVITILPSLCLVAELVSCVLLLISNYDGGSVVSLAEIDWNIVYYSMTVATNILCTGSIVLRIIYINGKIRTYRGIIEILVESAMLYSITYITYIAVYAYAYNDVHYNESHFYPGAMLSAVTGISPTLIIARVASGRARPDDSWRKDTTSNVLSTLHFHSSESSPESQVHGRQATSEYGDVDVNTAPQAIRHTRSSEQSQRNETPESER
ncbi:hypothetical protein BDZ89DRAFT_1163821 [Hymenopellis radicata]|nr:hypothetical protein BDZ89DRAFT_1163821 [Hymenopellis radicata]